MYAEITKLYLITLAKLCI